MSTYAIMGVTGQVGGTAARQLLAQGAHVRAVMRNKNKASEWKARGAEVVVADLHDASALADAFVDVDGIFIMTPTWFEAPDMFAENARALQVLKQALKTVSPTRIVALSSIGAHLPSGTGAIGKLHDMEKVFSDLPSVTAVRAAWFMENYAGLIDYVRDNGQLPSMLNPLDRAIPMVATNDIGRVIADTLQKEWAGQHVIELEGPLRYAPNDVAGTFARVLAREVHAMALPRSDWHGAFGSWGLTARSADAMAEMLDGFNSGHIVFSNDAATVHGETTLETVLANVLGHQMHHRA